jgi:hypothetical protein
VKNHNSSLREYRVGLAEPRREGSYSLIPEDRIFGKNYIVYRVKLPPLEVTEETRNDILRGLGGNKKYVQIGDCTVMINSIASIEPLSVIDKEKYLEKEKEAERMIKTAKERQERYAEVERRVRGEI